MIMNVFTCKHATMLQGTLNAIFNAQVIALFRTQ